MSIISNVTLQIEHMHMPTTSGRLTKTEWTFFCLYFLRACSEDINHRIPPETICKLFKLSITLGNFSYQSAELCSLSLYLFYHSSLCSKGNQLAWRSICIWYAFCIWSFNYGLIKIDKAFCSDLALLVMGPLKRRQRERQNKHLPNRARSKHKSQTGTLRTKARS